MQSWPTHTSCRLGFGQLNIEMWFDTKGVIVQVGKANNG